MWKTVGEVSRHGEELFFNCYFYKYKEPELKEAFKERKLASYFLVVSSVLLVLKIIVHLDGQWGYLSAREKLDEAATAILAFLLPLEWIMTPILSGLAMAVITWYTVFLDSFIPGVYPPSPLSPKKSRVHSRTFHMGYYLAVINGILIAAVMLHANLTHPSVL